VFGKALDFVCDHAYAFMLVGMVFVIVAFLMMFNLRGSGNAGMVRVTWGVGIVGMVIYLVGRAGVVYRDRRTVASDGPEDTEEADES
jgi:hypothetical protein